MNHLHLVLYVIQIWLSQTTSYPDISMKDTDPEMAAIAYDEEETGASRRKTRELCWVDKRTLPWKLLPGTALDLCARAQNRPLWVVDRMARVRYYHATKKVD